MSNSSRIWTEGPRTEGMWAAENEYILDNSLVATPRTLARRRKLIEKYKDGRIWPLHKMPIEVVWDADCVKRPDKWTPVGGDSRRPLAWITPRAWHEWHWFRGHDPREAREPIPLDVKRAVLERDWPYCQICGGLIALGEQHLDHIQPYSHGGPPTVENLRLAHDLCNMRRGDGRRDAEARHG